MPKRRVIIITNLYPHSSEPGRGVFIQQLVERIAQQWEVIVIAPIPWVPRWIKPRFNTRVELPLQTQLNGITVYHPQTVVIPKILRSCYGVLFFAGIYPLLKQLKQHFAPDLISAHWIYPDGFGALLAAKLLRIPIVLHALGCDINQYSLYPLRRQMIQYALRHAQRIIVKSADLKRCVRELGIDDQHTRVFMNGVDQKYFFPRPMADARRQLGLNLTRRYLLFVGNFQIEKGLAHLLDAMPEILRELPQLQLILIGGGRMQQLVEEQIDRLQIRRAVLMQGRVPHKQIPLYMSAANLLCLPSLREGCPNVVLEALSCGTPVVASRVGAVPDIITRPEWGVTVPTQNATAIAQGVLQAISLKDQPIPHFQWHSWEENAQVISAEFQAVLQES
jgi:teichuronic acid biosynthesis glycosyltransferase TuaC